MSKQDRKLLVVIKVAARKAYMYKYLIITRQLCDFTRSYSECRLKSGNKSTVVLKLMALIADISTSLKKSIEV